MGRIWDLIKPFAKKYRWLLVGTALLNMLPGLGIAFQTVAPKYLVDEVLAAPGLDLQTRCLRLGPCLRCGSSALSAFGCSAGIGAMVFSQRFVSRWLCS